MLIPLNCDAPIYHWPFATVGLIVANVVAFILVWPYMWEQNDAVVCWWILEYGNGLQPVQWLTSNFAHLGPVHLIGNMVFLWLFGMVVEGKLGWWKFLAVYLGIGVVQAALTQILLLGMDGPAFSLGASSAIYGIIAMAIVWAPKNEITCFYFFWFLVIVVGTCEISIITFACIYIAFDILDVVFQVVMYGGVLSTGWLHVMGAMVGAPVGVWLYKSKLVDCEGWDIFHAFGSDVEKEPDYTEIDKQVAKKKATKEQQHLDAAKEQFDAYLAEDNIRAAATLVKKMRRIGGGLQLDRRELLMLIRGLHERQEIADSVPLMSELVKRFPNGCDAVRIKLAQICVTEIQKPARTLELLEPVELASLPEKHQQLARRIASKAKKLQAEGVYELDDDAT